MFTYAPPARAPAGEPSQSQSQSPNRSPPHLHAAIAGLRAGPLYSHPEELEALDAPASGPRASCDIDIEMAWASPRALEDGAGVREKDAVGGGRKAFGKAWMAHEEEDEDLGGKEVGVSYAYRDEMGRYHRVLGGRRMTAGSWVAMVVLLALSTWVILAQTL
ncbi:hypothetical protein DENSPDRAFT_929933 [Dentipellis sp. KUC8613]|nr:hypothetical protein DENSPDRAFT_929933 [Dentipellis sp. KUC8613]